MEKHKIKIMVGLSGGVDSAVALYLLKKAGYDVSAGFMRNWDSLANNDLLGNPTLMDDNCPQEVDYEDAKKIADALGVKLYRVDFVKQYWDNVFLDFLKEYEQGRTPNPDIFCNKYIKFDAFLNWANRLGFPYIATGHYAKKVVKNNNVYLYESKDKEKDQTYFLSQLSNKQISQTFFPLGDLTKDEVRQIARELKLDVATKTDSTGICFIGERNFRDFLKNYIPMQQGTIVDLRTNEVIGIHQGVFYYTIGQRKGLGIGGLKGREDNPRWYVAKKDVQTNTLYVASDDESIYLQSTKITFTDLNFTNEEVPNGTKVFVRFRHRQKKVAATFFKLTEKTGELLFPTPYLSVTPGQAVVFYDGEKCLGGAIISDVYFHDEKRN